MSSSVVSPPIQDDGTVGVDRRFDAAAFAADTTSAENIARGARFCLDDLHGSFILDDDSSIPWNNVDARATKSFATSSWMDGDLEHALIASQHAKGSPAEADVTIVLVDEIAL
jgi:hypothetical protein